MYNTIEEYALAMSTLLFEMRIESEYCNEEVSEEYFNKIVDERYHIILIKNKLYDAILKDATKFPDIHKNSEGELGYNTNTYDFTTLIDEYVEELHESERQARLIKKYKVWVEVERIETDPETDDEDYIDEECPIGITYCDSLEDAIELQEEIKKTFGTI